MKHLIFATFILVLLACNPNQSGPTGTDSTDTISAPVDTVVVDSTNDTLN